jgi:TATA-box binding protein (TBP) (component of TFIID and TFIIIB)
VFHKLDKNIENINIENIMSNENIEQTYPKFEASPISVSTMTFLGNLNTTINLNILARFLNLVSPDSELIEKSSHGFPVYIEYYRLLPQGEYCGKRSKRKKKEIQIKNTKYNDVDELSDINQVIIKNDDQLSIKEKKKPAKRQFNNQATMIYRFKGNRLVNIKIFNNGKLQITGVKSEEEVKKVINELIPLLVNTKYNVIENKPNEGIVNQYLLSKTSDDKLQVYRYLKNMTSEDDIYDWIPSDDKFLNTLNKPEDFLTITKPNEIHLTDLEIVLINSNYKINFNIDRNVLAYILSVEEGIYCSFEANEYQGVKISYYWNQSQKLSEKYGICSCDVHCRTTKNKNKKSSTPCILITISVFRTGSIIITGARDMDQINDAYNFINNIIIKNIERIYQKPDKPKEKKQVGRKKKIEKQPIVITLMSPLEIIKMRLKEKDQENKLLNKKQNQNVKLDKKANEKKLIEKKPIEKKPIEKKNKLNKNMAKIKIDKSGEQIMTYGIEQN